MTNFPHGNDDIEIAVAETRAAVAYGADEVDVVFPYRALMAGNEQVGFELVKACKAACGERVLLKVIIETGELKSEALIRRASELAIDAGADLTALQENLKCGTFCGGCIPDIKRLLLRQVQQQPEAA